MRISDALALKVGSTVFIDYSGPVSGHDCHIRCNGKVKHVSTEVHKNIYNVEYVWVTVKYQDSTSVFPSFCLVKL